MDGGDTRGPGAGALLLGAVAEIAMIGVALVTWPFVALDNRHGWTVRARRHRAMDALRQAPAVSIEQADDAGRAILEGTLEPAGPLVRVPTLDEDALAWGAWAIDGGFIHFIDGAATTIDLVDGTGRARLDLAGARDLPYGLGRHAAVREVPPAWIERGGARVDDWTVTWVPPGTRARASGQLAPLTARASAYRDGGLVRSLTADADGVPVLLATMRPPPRA